MILEMVREPGPYPLPQQDTKWSWRILALASAVPVVVTLILYRWDVPLGDPDWIVYRYSPFISQRLLRVPAALLIGGVTACSLLLMGSQARRRQRAGLALAAVGCVAMAIWSFVAPPSFLSQQVFNMRSPSHDGAFLLESYRVDGLRAYLGGFADRATTPPEKMRGTRVVSNPPGTTLLARGTTSALTRWPALGRWIDPTSDADGLTVEQRRLVIEALAFAGVLTGLWLAAVPFLYLAARVFLPPLGAAALAIFCFVSPMTLSFTPGKDPAQLLTMAVPMWLWLRACRDERWWLAALAGGAFTLSCLVSLVHVWIAAVLVAACVLRARRTPGGLGRLWRAALAPAAVGASVVATGLYLCCNCNLAAIAWSVARAQSAVTRGPGSMPLGIELLGIPLFLLLAGPAWWCGVLWWARARVADDGGRFGLCLFCGAAAVMLATIGFTNMETPRLWIPFVPLLMLGTGLQAPRLRDAGRTLRWMLAALVLAQLTCSAVQWSFLDAREAEMRLSTTEPRFFE